MLPDDYAKGWRPGNESGRVLAVGITGTIGEGLSKCYQVGSLLTIARDLKCSFTVDLWKAGHLRKKFRVPDHIADPLWGRQWSSYTGNISDFVTLLSSAFATGEHL